MSWSDRILVISPHVDDETIGCGGLLTHFQNSARLVVVMALGDIEFGHVGMVTHQQRWEELMNALMVLDPNVYSTLQDPHDVFPTAGGRLFYYEDSHGDECSLPMYKDTQLDTVPQKILIAGLDRVIEKFRPTSVFFPYPSHHQDHRATYQACIAALRPCPARSHIQLAAMFEYPFHSWFNGGVEGGAMYLELTEEELQRKLKAFSAHKSQVRQDPRDLLSLDTIRSMAETRGREIGMRYAEKFYVLSGRLNNGTES